MKQMYCWRCKCTVPMLDEEEFAHLDRVYQDCAKAVIQYRKDHRVSLTQTPVADLFQAAHRCYEQLTGTTGVATEELLKHRIALYGRPCPQCAKPLRTPKARQCFECDAKVSAAIKPTDATEEQNKGRIAVWLDPEDVRFLAAHCSCSPNAKRGEEQRCGRIRFRASAALHKSGWENADVQQ